MRQPGEGGRLPVFDGVVATLEQLETLLAPLAKEELGHLAALLRVVALAVEEDGPPLMPHVD
ncbi:hypothetical protein [Streptomyces cyslabdanicus]|uniref:hypothetical protein n=1 Tax=Streptomyces cyslabdanicus TaxID=1470456 RepID=UPI0040446BBF